MPSFSQNNSFFLFGARGTGKSTLIDLKYRFPDTLWIDLLLYEEEDKFLTNPDELLWMVRQTSYKRVVIDEIQKVPKLLDIVQKLMREKPQIQFILTGSSARKLKRGSGNLLAGRAFPYYLFPISIFELSANAPIHDLLQFGSLPEVLNRKTKQDKIDFLKGYVQTYLKEEVMSEQIIRKLNPFKNFLQVASQQNGKIINYSNIARDIRADDKTVKIYFSVLEDTLIGFSLPAYHKSFRKQHILSPKFYFFDTGVKRALDKQINIPLIAQTHDYGNAFEHRIILECFYLNEYLRTDFNFYHLRTKEGQEIDLVIERPGEQTLLVEIKSTTAIQEKHIKPLSRFKKSWPDKCQAEVWSQDKTNKKINKIQCLFWRSRLKTLFFN